MPEFDPRGREFTWPQPWEHLSPETDWTVGCREQYLVVVDPAQVAAAAQDLVATLKREPGTYWAFGAAVLELAGAYNITHRTARRLLLDAPGSAAPQQGVWCAAGAGGDWQQVKRTVFGVLARDRVMTFDQVCASLAPEINQTTVYCALERLVNADRSAVALRDNPIDEVCYTVARPRGHRADYTDVYTSTAPQAAA